MGSQLYKQFFMIVLFCSSLYASDLYYNVQIQGRSIGYIKSNESQESVYQGEKVSQRETFIVFRLEDAIGQKGSYVLQEKTITRTHDNYVLSYLMSYQKGAISGEQSFLFEGRRVQAKHTLNEEVLLEETYALPENVSITTDYFSLLPFFQKCKQHPLSISIVDPKKIKGAKISVQKMVIIPLGIRLLEVQGKKESTHAYRLKNDEGQLTFWLSKNKQKILRIQENRVNGTTIELSTSEVKEKIQESANSEKRFFFPYKLGQVYRYIFHSGKQKMGSIRFTFELSEKKQYKVEAEGSFYNGNLTFKSTTKYSETFAPLTYILKEDKQGKKSKIRCEFIHGGVKERYTTTQTMDRLIPLPPQFIFLDNNSLHHFAVFILQFPLDDTKKNIIYNIFHPRRMRVTQSKFYFEGLEERLRKYRIETPFHTLKIWVSEKGHLIKYQQGNLVAQLQVKKDE